MLSSWGLWIIDGMIVWNQTQSTACKKNNYSSVQEQRACRYLASCCMDYEPQAISWFMDWVWKSAHYISSLFFCKIGHLHISLCRHLVKWLQSRWKHFLRCDWWSRKCHEHLTLVWFLPEIIHSDFTGEKTELFTFLETLEYNQQLWMQNRETFEWEASKKKTKSLYFKGCFVFTGHSRENRQSGFSVQQRFHTEANSKKLWC